MPCGLPKVGIDFVSLSFVRSPVEVRLLKELLHTRGSKAKVVAKIEKPEALDALEAIVEATDAVMVARGDLGVEIDVARMRWCKNKLWQCAIAISGRSFALRKCSTACSTTNAPPRLR